MCNNKRYPVVMSIAGSDSGGGAGIQADLKTFSALGTFGTTAITALTAQNTKGVFDIYPIPTSFLKEQINAIFEDLKPVAVKIGMLHTKEVAEEVALCLSLYDIKNIVLDPVMVATSGDRLIEQDTLDALKTLLIPIASIVTPNLDEAEILVGYKIDSLELMKKAAKDLILLGCNSVLLKGGHLKGKNMYDVFQDKTEQYIFVSDYVETKNTHGTGCTLSSAIAAYLAKGYLLKDAVREAKEYITNAINAGKNIHIGEGNGPVNHFFNPQKLKGK